MRHRKAGRKLNRTWEHRKAMFRNMAKAIIENEKIKTTEPKARELVKLADKLIVFGLENTLHARRKAYKVLGNHWLVKRLFDEIAPRYKGISGGYTRIFKLPNPRKGDAAQMAVVELRKPEQQPSEN